MPICHSGKSSKSAKGSLYQIIRLTPDENSQGGQHRPKYKLRISKWKSRSSVQSTNVPHCIHLPLHQLLQSMRKLGQILGWVACPFWVKISARSSIWAGRSHTLFQGLHRPPSCCFYRTQCLDKFRIMHSRQNTYNTHFISEANERTPCSNPLHL